MARTLLGLLVARANEGAHVLDGASALVPEDLTIALAREIENRWEGADRIFFAWLLLAGAVDTADPDVLEISLAELLPQWVQLFAVPTPWRVEFDDHCGGAHKMASQFMSMLHKKWSPAEKRMAARNAERSTAARVRRTLVELVVDIRLRDRDDLGIRADREQKCKVQSSHRSPHRS